MPPLRFDLSSHRIHLLAAASLALVSTAQPGTAAAPPCAGDCNGDGRVTISELLTAVRVALGDDPLAHCAAADASGDGRVNVGDLVRAVSHAASGCPAQPPPATATTTVTASPTTPPAPTPTAARRFRVCGCVDEFPMIPGGCGERDYTATLQPLGRSTRPDFQTSVFCFEAIPPGDYTLHLSPTCNGNGCWPAEIAVQVVDREVGIFIPATAPADGAAPAHR